MELNLRRANAVQTAINEAIKSLDLNTSVTLNEFEGVKEQIDAVRERFWKDAETRSGLVMALYQIRAKIAQANAASGINDHLARIAYLDKQISHNTMLAGKGAQTSIRVLNGQVKKDAEAKSDVYYGRQATTTSIFTEQEIESFKHAGADYKREKQRLQDILLELNVQTKIDLNEETVQCLKKADIL